MHSSLSSESKRLEILNIIKYFIKYNYSTYRHLIFKTYIKLYALPTYFYYIVRFNLFIITCTFAAAKAFGDIRKKCTVINFN